MAAVTGAAPPAEVIRKLAPADAAAYQHLRLEALETAPFAFGTTPAEHRATTTYIDEDQMILRLR